MHAHREGVDEADVGRFGRLGDQWWDTRGSMRMLHRLNPVRVNWVVETALRHLARPPTSGGRRRLAGLDVLEIGCGGGIFCEPLAREGAAATGIDPAPKSIEVAKRHAAEAGLSIDYRATTAEELAATGARFDMVCAMEVIEHVPDPRSFVKTAGGLVRPGGLLFAATLNRTLKSFALAIVGAEHVLRWVPPGTHRWEQFVTPREMEEAMEAAGLDPCARSGVVYDPLRGLWRESHDMAINYMMAARRD